MLIKIIKSVGSYVSENVNYIGRYLDYLIELDEREKETEEGGVLYYNPRLIGKVFHNIKPGKFHISIKDFRDGKYCGKNKN